ncbi:MAG: hypothetical protein AAB524_03040 [Patescibacteria group bacterium]
MKLINTQAQTNWKFIAVVAVLCLVSIGGILVLKTMEPVPSPQPQRYFDRAVRED